MKLAKRTFKIQWNLHGWVGLACAVPIFVMFFCGVFALYEDQLELWQEPELWSDESICQAADCYRRAEAMLAQEVDVRKADKVEFLHFDDTPFLLGRVGPDHAQQRWVNPDSGKIIPRRSNLAHSLNQLHYLGQLPAGTQISGVFSIALLVLSLGGLLIFLKDIPSLLWTFRPEKKRKLWCADLHRTLGLWTLPFIVAIAWSGALLGLGGVFGAGLVGGDIVKLQDIRGYGSIEYSPTGKKAQAKDLAELIESAQRSVQSDELPHYAGLHLRQDANAWGFIFFESDMVQPWRYVFLDAVSGEINIDTSHAHSPSRAFEERLFGYHFGRFGGAFVRLAFIALAWLVCAMIVAGQVIWIERPASRKWPRLQKLVGRLTVGGCCGLVLACAGYFVLNRVMPAGVEHRANLLWNLFLGVWLGLSVLALLVPTRSSRLAGWYLLGSAPLFLLVVLYDRLALRGEAAMPDSLLEVHLLLGMLGLGSLGLAIYALRGFSKEKADPLNAAR